MKLPGEAKRRPYVEPRERVPSDDIPNAEVRRLILAKLDVRPHAKWELRTTLGINDDRLLRELTAMRKLGQVRATGVRSRERIWKRVTP